MKYWLPAFAAAVVASLLTAGFLELSRDDGSRGNAAVASAPDTGPTETPAERERPAARLAPPEDGKSIEELERRLAELETRIGALGAGSARQVVASPEATPVEDDPLLEESDEAREFVLAVVEEERAAAEEERARRVAELNEERMRERAREIAAELGLPGRDEDTIFSVFLQESTRRAEIFETMRTGDFAPGSRDALRDEFAALRRWKEEELTKELGDVIAQRVLELEPRGGRRGGLGDRGRGPRPGGN